MWIQWWAWSLPSWDKTKALTHETKTRLKHLPVGPSPRHDQDLCPRWNWAEVWSAGTPWDRGAKIKATSLDKVQILLMGRWINGSRIVKSHIASCWSLALKWPIMYWCAVKKLLTHSHWSLILFINFTYITLGHYSVICIYSRCHRTLRVQTSKHQTNFWTQPWLLRITPSAVLPGCDISYVYCSYKVVAYAW